MLLLLRSGVRHGSSLFGLLGLVVLLAEPINNSFAATWLTKTIAADNVIAPVFLLVDYHCCGLIDIERNLLEVSLHQPCG
jgi:hypothetical protein